MKQKWFGSSAKGCYHNNPSDFLSYDEIYEMMAKPANELCLAFSTPYEVFGHYVSRQFKDVEDYLVQQRNFILRFKQGIEKDTSRAASMVAEFLMRAGLLNEYTFVCVPASSPNAHELRFKKFMEEISRLTGITNGYDLVQVISSRKEVHFGGTRSKKNYLISSSVKNKKIVLFDDVITTGNTFVSFGSELEKLGADVIQGVFLAEAILP